MLSSEGHLLHVALAWLMDVTTPPVVKYTNRTKKLTVGGKVLVYFTGQGIQNQGDKVYHDTT